MLSLGHLEFDLVAALDVGVIQLAVVIDFCGISGRVEGEHLILSLIIKWIEKELLVLVDLVVTGFSPIEVIIREQELFLVYQSGVRPTPVVLPRLVESFSDKLSVFRIVNFDSVLTQKYYVFSEELSFFV